MSGSTNTINLWGELQMKAAQFYDREDVRIEEVPEPTPGPGQVKLRNAYAGICGSDLHVYYTPEASGMDFTKPHPLTGTMPPQILGHEFSGTVVALGEGVTSVAIGDRAAVWPVYYCDECAACRKGLYNICAKLGIHGVTSDGGGMAEFTTVPASMLHTLPENVDLRYGALVEPMAVGWHAVERSGIKPGQTALIVGAGPIGISVWFALRAQGIETVIVSEPIEARRGAIAGVGASLLVDPSTENLADRIADITHGDGVDVAFDAAGVAAATLEAMSNLGPHGKVVMIAFHEKPMQFNPTQLVMAETQMLGTLAYTRADFDAVIAAMAEGKYSTEGWVDDIAVEELATTFAALRAGRGMKVLVKN
jgi:(R,R)-butanediol dehydrogenase/meso-butanediol dehydrogenase/diacetyl reductase